MLSLTDIQPGGYCKAFNALARQHARDATKAVTAANDLWPAVGSHGVDPAAMGCDDDLITLGLAKDEGGIVYMKFDLSGWDV